MNRQKAIREYLESQKLVGENYSNSKIEEIIKKGIKFNIDIYKNSELTKEILENFNDTKIEFQKEIELIKNLKECEKNAQLSKN